MTTYMYMTVIPEALVGSMLNPEDFAPYLSTGSRKSSHGRAIFFEIDAKALPSSFDLSKIETIAPHPDGGPKRSQTVSVYRVIERIPVSAFGRMFLVTRDGRYISISPQPYVQKPSNLLRLYQELCPIRSTLVSKLDPQAFGRFITGGEPHLGVPRILFADLVLGRMADSSSAITEGMLPYADIGNIRDAIGLLRSSERQTLMVDRAHSSDFFYRTVGEGFFLADGNQTIHYPFPSREEREGPLHSWWRSAELS